MCPSAFDHATSSESTEPVTVTVPAEFWSSVQSLAQSANVSPEAVIAAGTSLYSLALKAKQQGRKLAVIEWDQPCIMEVTGL
ncbi:hypothetical protein [Lyngbya confervoides]|uniref:Uncharacterized protein n=1 Tax=Lyngbya confervoides BDU141951 TaxID=1574623 RepID=A0ABD4T346_9CYAN|nr:hypothetical protein [Lyngbya confervoides]MCM1982860.1 hypothetical protein [Lyngbya confervoides BDU141951]